MTIYVDILFLENFILNFIILYSAGIIAKSKIKFLKIGLRKFYRSDLCSNVLLYEK